MKTFASVLAALLIVSAGCGSGNDDLLSERTGELGTAARALVDEVGAHASALMVAEDMDEILAAEREHVRNVEHHLDVAVFWAGEITNCDVDTTTVDGLLADAAVALAQHQLVIMWADTISAIHEEGWRYAAGMMGAGTQLIDAARALDAEAGDTTCPALTADPPYEIIERPPLFDPTPRAPRHEGGWDI